MTGVLTVSIWHNVTRDAEGRHAGFGGFTPGDQMVKVFTYDLPPGGTRDLTAIAENAFAIGNGAPPRRPGRRAGCPVRPANAPVSLVPWKVSVLRLVVLRAISVCVVQGAPGVSLPAACCHRR